MPRTLACRPIFVIGSPGSGSGAVAEMLSKAHRCARLPLAARAQAGALWEKYAAADSADKAQLKRDIRTLFAKAASAGRIVSRAVTASGLLEVFPKAQIVYVHRTPSHHIATLSRFLSTPWDATAARWQWTTQSAIETLNHVPTAQWCSVAFDDLVGNPEEELQWLGQFLGVRWKTDSHLRDIMARYDASSAKAVALHQGAPFAALEEQVARLHHRHHAAWACMDAARNGAAQRLASTARGAGFAARMAASVCLGVVAWPHIASATSYVVSNANDSGTNSLRAALTSANGNPGADTVTFSGVNQPIMLQSALSITDSVTITGPGPTALTLDGNQTQLASIVSASGFINVSISGLTLQNGNTTNVGGGGCAYVKATNLDLNDVVVTGCTAPKGGGLSLAGNGNFIVANSTFSGNTSTSSGGGGFYASGGNVVVQNSVFSNNVSKQRGGAFRESGVQETVIQNCNFVGNRAASNGGAAYITGGTSVVIDSTVAQNNNAVSSGGFLATDVPLTMTNTTVANNAAGRGGAFYSWSGGFIVRNSTITANTAATGGGAAVFYTNPPTHVGVLDFCTIADNVSGRPGALYLNQNTTDLTITNSIITGNHAPGTAVDPNNAGADINAGSSAKGNVRISFTDLTTNPNGPASVTFTSGAGNLHGVDPQLGTLQNNGGATPTMLPAAGSPVINAADPNLRVDDPNVTTDQRGQARVYGTAADMGAVERGAATGGTSTTTGGGATTGGSHNGGGGGCAGIPVDGNGTLLAGMGLGLAATLRRYWRRQRAR